MLEPHRIQCPYCWERVEITIDLSAGNKQDYVEDCSVCCRPWNVKVTLSESSDWEVAVEPAG